jgi:predicted transcriptional regulator
MTSLPASRVRNVENLPVAERHHDMFDRRIITPIDIDSVSVEYSRITEMNRQKCLHSLARIADLGSVGGGEYG